MHVVEIESFIYFTFLCVSLCESLARSILSADSLSCSLALSRSLALDLSLARSPLSLVLPRFLPPSSLLILRFTFHDGAVARTVLATDAPSAVMAKGGSHCPIWRVRSDLRSVSPMTTVSAMTTTLDTGLNLSFIWTTQVPEAVVFSSCIAWCRSSGGRMAA